VRAGTYPPSLSSLHDGAVVVDGSDDGFLDDDAVSVDKDKSAPGSPNIGGGVGSGGGGGGGGGGGSGGGDDGGDGGGGGGGVGNTRGRLASDRSATDESESSDGDDDGDGDGDDDDVANKSIAERDFMIKGACACEI
jgi:hypothetical protein